MRRSWLPLTLVLALSGASTALGVDKSGVSPNTVSLPGGPGSIEGLGDAFQPKLNTGTAEHGVAIAVPPGTNGNAPDLALQYESGSGNGPLGYGWSLPLLFIQRQTEKGIPRYVDGPNEEDDDLDGETDELDENDVFVNDMKEELVPVAGAAGIDYFCENESLFVRYRRVADHWEAKRPDGTLLVFGESASARIVDGDNPARVFRWLLEKLVDTHGNTIVFEYTAFLEPNNRNQVYCALIRYGPGAPPWQNFHFVRFSHEDRADWFEDGRAGFAVRTGKRLKSIIVGAQGPTLENHARADFSGDGITDNLVRRYELAYGSGSFWSLLESVTVTGADGQSTLPPARFDYTICDSRSLFSAADRVVVSTDGLPVAFDNELVDLADLNGDALPDLLRTPREGGAHTVYINSGEIDTPGGRRLRWSEAREVGTPTADPGSWNVDLRSDAVRLSDMDGDGLADLVTATEFNTYFYKNTPRGEGGNQSWSGRHIVSSTDETPPSPFAFSNVKIADVDFDKRMDVIRSIDVGTRAAYQIWLNLGAERYSKVLTVFPTTGYRFLEAAVHIADVNGDRVPDIAKIRPTSIVVTAGLGYGKFLPEVVMVIPDVSLRPEHLEKAELEDVTGDGLADLVIERAFAGELWFWVNRGNYTLENRRRVVGLPTSLGNQPDVRWADLNGNGTTDLVYGASDILPKIQMVDVGALMGCVPRPHLLRYIENGIGRVTRVEYATSTKYALEDGTDENGRYEYAAPDPLPFPVDVVSRVITDDSLGNETISEFAYHDGYYDPIEHQFRGFARVEQIDRGDETAPTLVTHSRFDTGESDEVLKGKLLGLSARTESGAVFWDENTDWTIRELETGTDGKAVRFAHPVFTGRDIRELDRGTARRVESTFAYDRHGNRTETRNFGVVVAGDRNAMDDEVTTTTEFALNLEKWLLRFPARIEVKDRDGVVISRSETYYDDPTFSGTNFGTVSVGNATLVRDWEDPANPTTFLDSMRARFDAHGNPTELLDALAVAPGGQIDDTAGHYRSITWDSLFHSLPIVETIHVGNGSEDLIVRVAYDPGFGAVTRSTDFNGFETRYLYDAFARPVAVVRPLDTEELPSIEYSYGLAQPTESGGLVNFVESRSLDRANAEGSRRDRYHLGRVYIDGLGRELMTREEAEPGLNTGRPRVVVSGTRLFNARAIAKAALHPFYSQREADDLDSLLGFEDIRAAGWRGQFHRDGELVSLDLANAHKSTVVHDAMLRELEVIHADGTRNRSEYEPLLSRSFDENDVDAASPHADTPLVHHVDGLGRLRQVDEIVRLGDDGTPAENLKVWSTHYDYRADGLITTLTDSQQNVKRVEYDGLGLMIRLEDPDRGVTRYVWDAASNLIERVDARGQRITYTHDGVNRLLTEDYHDNEAAFSYNRDPDVIYVYDEPAGELDLGDGTRGTALNTRGFLSWVDDATGEEHTSYDERGRVAWELKRVRHPESNELSSYKTAVRHDSIDRLVELTYPDGDNVTYEYNTRGLIERVRHAGARSIVRGVDYSPTAQLTNVAYGNGVVTRYGYDLRQRLTALRSALESVTARPLIDYRYTFDAASNLTSIADLRPESAELPAGDPRRNTQSFVYDDLYRLSAVRYAFQSPGQPPGDDGRIGYRYDRIGNMIAKTSGIDHLDDKTGLSVTNLGKMSYGSGEDGAHGRVGRASGDPPGPHALTSTTTGRTYDYDANGNMTSIDGLSVTWDFGDRQVVAENETMRAEYRYDYTGRRITKQVTPKGPEPEPAEMTLYVNRYYEARDNGSAVKYVWNGETRVARLVADSDTERTQRFAVEPGWNLFTMVVEAADAATQIGIGTEAIDQAYLWSSVEREFFEVSAGSPIPAGTILWLLVTVPGTFEVRGSYNDPGDETVELTQGDFVPVKRLEGVCIDDFLTSRPAQLWQYSAELQSWQPILTGELAFLSQGSDRLAPGSAVYVETTGPLELQIRAPPAPERIEYYHQDHLGSSNVIANSDGRVVKETAFYPFGHPRNEYKATNAEFIDGAPYLFTQKERDRETGLQYFEARYYAGSLGRFTRVDPLAEGIAGAALLDPQMVNAYSYSINHPLRFTDPSGEGPNDRLPGGEKKPGRLKRLGRALSRASDTTSRAAERVPVVGRRVARAIPSGAAAARTFETGEGATRAAVAGARTAASTGAGLVAGVAANLVLPGAGEAVGTVVSGVTSAGVEGGARVVGAQGLRRLEITGEGEAANLLQGDEREAPGAETIAEDVRAAGGVVATRLAGGVPGSVVGAAGGAAVGTAILPGLGTVVGAGVGGFVGGKVGAAGAAKAAAVGEKGAGVAGKGATRLRRAARDQRFRNRGYGKLGDGDSDSESDSDSD